LARELPSGQFGAFDRKCPVAENCHCCGVFENSKSVDNISVSGKIKLILGFGLLDLNAFKDLEPLNRDCVFQPSFV